MPNNTSPQQKLKINVQDLPMHVCPKCNNSSFVNAIEIRIVSQILSPSGEREMIRTPVAVCSICGRKVLNEDLEEKLFSEPV